MKKLVTFIFALLLTSAISAQSLEITQPLQMIEHSSVMVQYQNQFGKWNMPDKDDTFPFAVIVMQLEGTANEVRAAKEEIQLDLGTQKMVTDQYRDKPNEILFLVENTVKNVYVTCGEGCNKQLLISGARFRSNMVYRCKVKFNPGESQISSNVGYIKWQVTPMSDKQTWVSISGKDFELNSDSLIYFGYQLERQYIIRIHREFYADYVDTLTLSEKTKEINVTLRPEYNKINLKVKDKEPFTYTIDRGETIYSATNQPGQLSKGTHILHISQVDHIDKDFEISLSGDCSTQEINVQLPYRLGQLGINSPMKNCDVYLDGVLVGTTPQILPTVNVGTHQVTIKKEGFLPKDTTFRVEENVLTKINLSLNQIRLGTSMGSGRAKNVHAEITPENVIVHYDLTARSSVKMQKSYGDSQQWSDVEQVSGDVNKIISRGNHKKIIWDIHNEMGNDFVADNLRFNVIGNEQPWKTSILLNTSYNLVGSYATIDQRWTLGFMIIRKKLIGWFIKGRTGFNYAGIGYDKYAKNNQCYIRNDESKVYTPLYTGKMARTLLSLSGGITCQLGCPLNMYLGCGYGYQSLSWGVNTDKKPWVYQPEYSLGHGLEIDGGLFYDFYHWTISLGVCSIIGFGGEDVRTVPTSSGQKEIHRPTPVDLEVGFGYRF